MRVEVSGELIHAGFQVLKSVNECKFQHAD